MEKIYEKFEEMVSIPSDINQHLWTLRKYSEECETVIEMGVRGIVSTWAFLAAKPKNITCYDISDLNLDEPKNLAKENNISLKFIRANVLEIEIEKTDLLFLDTIHRYYQLFNELNIHAKNVKKYILMHDTISYGKDDEFIYIPNYVSPVVENKKGLIMAIEDFFLTEEGKNWYVLEKFENNNGLTILERKK